MKKYNLYVGLNDKDTKAQKLDTVEAYKIATNLIVHGFGGGTIYAVDGIYMHDNGEVVIEKTLKIELLNAEEEKVNELISTLKTVFNQESILKQTEDVTYSFE